MIFGAVLAVLAAAAVWLKPWGPLFGCRLTTDPTQQQQIFGAALPYFEVTKGDNTRAEEIEANRDLSDFEYRRCWNRYVFSMVASQAQLDRMARAEQDDTVLYFYTHDFDLHLVISRGFQITHIWFGDQVTMTWDQFLSD